MANSKNKTKTTGKTTTTTTNGVYSKICSNVYKNANRYRVCVKGVNKYFDKRKDALACRKTMLAKGA